MHLFSFSLIEREIEKLSPPQSIKSAITPKKRSWISNEVEEELQLMAGTNDIKEELGNTIGRPEERPFIAPPPLALEPTTSLTRSFSHRPKMFSGASKSLSSAMAKKVPVSVAEAKKVGHLAPSKSSTNLPLRKTENSSSVTKASQESIKCK